MNDDKYDIPEGEAMEPVDENFDAFANVGQGLVGPHKTAMLQYWQQAIDDIERINDDGTEVDVFKSTVLPLARIKKVMKTDLDVKMISAEAPILFAKGCDIFITELTMRAWIHAEENKRRTLQRSDIATAIQKSDVFDFLIDIIPREEAQPRRSHRGHDHQVLAEFPSPHGNRNGTEGLDIDQKSMLGSMPNHMPNQMQNQMQNQIPGSIPGQIPGSLGDAMSAPGNMIPGSETYSANPSMMQLNLNHLNPQMTHQPPSSLANPAIPPHLNANTMYGSPSMTNQDLHNQGLHNHHLGANAPGNPQSNRSLLHSHRSLENLTNAASLGLDMNAMLSSGVDSQLPDMSYSSMDAYLNPPSFAKTKDSRPEEVEGKPDDRSGSGQNFPKIKDENASDHAQFANDMPFGYAEPVDVSHYEQNL